MEVFFLKSVLFEKNVEVKFWWPSSSYFSFYSFLRFEFDQ